MEPFSLLAAETHTKLQITAITAETALQNHLAKLGFLQSTHIEVLQNAGRGPLMVLIRGSRLALGQKLADKIIVKPVDECI